LNIAEELQQCKEIIKKQENEIARIKMDNEFLERASRFFATSREK
jgi:transposase